MSDSGGEGEGSPGSVYLDYNATTPLAEEVQQAMIAALPVWGNPSSGYHRGRSAAALVQHSRAQVAAMLGADSKEIVFTSGGTESNHLAIWTALASYRAVGAVGGATCPPATSCHSAGPAIPHVVTSNIEHCAVAEPLRQLERAGHCTVTWVPVVPGTGRWTVESVLAAVTPHTCLVTLMIANNETGILQPVAELFSALRSLTPARSRPLLLHTDAAQAVGKLPVSVRDLQVDLLSLAGHKFYGPRVGALYVRAGTKLTPMFYGGGQEGGQRAGTENAVMVAGLGAAASLVTANLAQYSAHMREMRDYLRDRLISSFRLVTGEERRPLGRGEVCWRYLPLHTLPNTLSVRLGGQTGAELLARCGGKVEASTGAACHTGAGPSQVLLASFLWGEVGARETVRLSVGRETTREEIDRAVAALVQAVYGGNK